MNDKICCNCKYYFPFLDFKINSIHGGKCRNLISVNSCEDVASNETCPYFAASVRIQSEKNENE